VVAPTLTENTQDMGIAAVRMERGVDCLVKRAVPQTLIKVSMHLLGPLLVKGR